MFLFFFKVYCFYIGSQQAPRLSWLQFTDPTSVLIRIADTESIALACVPNRRVKHGTVMDAPLRSVPQVPRLSGMPILIAGGCESPSGVPGQLPAFALNVTQAYPKDLPPTPFLPDCLVLRVTFNGQEFHLIRSAVRLCISPVSLL